MQRKLVVALIGGIGSGKSRVAAEFASRGAYVISGDAFGHQALRQPDIRDRVRQRWGDKVLDGSGEVDRKKLGALVFADARQLKELETLVFPYIERRIAEEIDRGR